MNKTLRTGLAAWILATGAVSAQSTALTYQGRLAVGTNAATGIYDLRFGLFDALSSGASVGPTLTNSALAVSNGFFTATLDFTNGAFPGADRWLEIGVRTNVSGAFTTLTPRQKITPTPYAITASNLTGALPASQLSGTVPDARLSASVSLLGSSIESAEITDGTIVNADINAAAAIADTKLATIATAGKVANSATTATNANFPNTIVARDATGGFFAATISASNFIGAFPAAQLSGVIPSANLSGAYSGALTLNNAANSFTGNGAGLTSLNASQLTSGTVPDARLAANVARTNQVWSLGGNAGTVAGVNFIGTTDAVPLEFRANSYTAFRLSYGAGLSSPNVIGGLGENGIGAGYQASVIAGGGGLGNPNLINANGSAIGGGVGNQISGGQNVIAGGQNNFINGTNVFIGGGVSNQATGISSVIGGGAFNTNSGNYATVAGGQGNTASGDYSIAAGYRANALHKGSFVWADSSGLAFSSTSSNQFLIRAAGGVGIGTNNPQGALDVNTGAGVIQMRNEGGVTPGINIVGSPNPGILRLRDALEVWPNDGATRPGRVDVRGTNGQPSIYLPANGNAFFLGGNVGIGTNNPTSQLEVSSGGGDSFPQARINQTNTADYARLRFTVGGDFSTRWDIGARSNVFSIYSGQIGADMLRLDSAGLTVNGTFVSASDRNVKENFAPVDPCAVLDKVAALPLSSWNYKTDAATRHLGPMAQDFYAAFNIGPDDKHIATVDADGVALAAIQGLNQKLEETRSENAALKARLEKLEQLLNRPATIPPSQP